MLSLIAAASIAADQNASVRRIFYWDRVQVSQPDCARQGRANRQSPVEVGRSVRAALLPAAPFLIAVRARACRLPAEAGLVAADQ